MDSKPTRPCLLLVDDTPSNIDILVGLLKEGHDLKIANRGAKALRICEEASRIDLILLDVMMPEMDGFEVCRRLREMPAMHEVPIIFLTAKAEADDVVHGLELGANDYVTKPFRPAELRARVHTHLLLRRQTLEIEQKNTELRELLHVVCHDVANQFSVMSLCVELMTEKPGQWDAAHVKPRLEAALRNGIGLTTMVRDMRRTEEKGIQLEDVPVGEVLAECLLLADDRLKGKDLTVTCSVPDTLVRAEKCTLTNSVFGNIISNAIKFSPEGGVLAITGEVAGDFLCVSFRDSGIGMPTEVLSTLFDVGKSHSRFGTKGEKGTGFGMPLMRRFVTEFGGRVEVTSRDIDEHPDDHGTQFRVFLRLAAAAPA